MNYKKKISTGNIKKIHEIAHILVCLLIMGQYFHKKYEIFTIEIMENVKRPL